MKTHTTNVQLESTCPETGSLAKDGDYVLD